MSLAYGRADGRGGEVGSWRADGRDPIGAGIGNQGVFSLFCGLKHSENNN